LIMAAFADLGVVQFLTSDTVLGLAKPVIIAFVVGFMFYIEVKPRLEASDKVEL